MITVFQPNPIVEIEESYLWPQIAPGEDGDMDRSEVERALAKTICIWSRSRIDLSEAMCNVLDGRYDHSASFEDAVTPYLDGVISTSVQTHSGVELIGLPGSGKTTIQRVMAGYLSNLSINVLQLSPTNMSLNYASSFAQHRARYGWEPDKRSFFQNAFWYIDDRIEPFLYIADRVLSSSDFIKFPIVQGGLLQNLVALAAYCNFDHFPKLWVKLLDVLPWFPKDIVWVDASRVTREVRIEASEDVVRRKHALASEHKILKMYLDLIRMANLNVRVINNNVDGEDFLLEEIDRVMKDH